MREILFRGKREDNGEWAMSRYPYGTMFNGVAVHDFIIKTVGQYTGLNDKNGNKIFEGDILKNTLDSSISIVEWSEAHTAFTLKQIGLSNLSVGGTIYGFPKIGHEVYLIIGNIYDNPEMIGGEENAEIH